MMNHRRNPRTTFQLLDVEHSEIVVMQVIFIHCTIGNLCNHKHYFTVCIRTKTM